MSDAQPQPQAQQAAGGQAPAIMRPDDILRLQCLTEDERQKYRQVMMSFWSMTQQHPAGSTEHTTARQKLYEYSQKFIAREKQHRNMKKQQQQGNQGQASQSNQVKQEGTQQPQGQPQPQEQPKVTNSSGGNAINPEILKHVQNFPIQLPLAGPAPGTPEYEAKVKEYRQGYLNMLGRQATFAENRRKLQHQIAERQQKGQEIPVEMTNLKMRYEKDHAQLAEQVEKFRKAQKNWKEERERKNAQDGQAQPAQQEQSQQSPSIQQQMQQQQTQPPQQAQAQQLQRQPSIPNMPTQQPVKEEQPQIKVEGGQIPQPQPNAQFNMQGNQQQMPPQNLQMPPSMQQQQQQQQQQQHNQQQQQQNQQHNQQQQQNRPPPAPHSQSMPPGQAPFQQPGQQIPHMPQNGRPQINPHQANAHQHQQSNSPHPQSATSGAPPVPLSHQAAVSAANRSYTDPQRTSTPMQQGQGNFGNREREQLNNPKMPIPRHLNVTSPAPVHMGQARPTMSGPTNGAPGPMGQPVIPRPPPFQLEGEGDRVLSKRKLDELVRQVTGGSEEALTSEVEEAVLQLADDFVDNVISSACKLSKLRESPQLDIRDLQLILERNYNIRIPGYASDEVRTVRKVVPAAGWVDKMKAVNAAKVMGGKADF